MPRPLDGLLVLDLSHVLSGPFATMILADLGADVVKIERPGWGDLARGNGPFFGQGEGRRSAYFMSINRGKRSVALDLERPKGKALFLRMVEVADVVLENFRPGAMAKLGLDYDALRRRNPRLVYAAISGFGQTGPYAAKPAFDVIVQGMGGIMSVTGEPGGGPVRPGTSLGDITASLYTVIGVLAALRERDRSGQGQMLDIGMMDCQVAILESAMSRYLATGEIPRPLGTRHPIATPFQAFKSSDGYVVVAIMGGERNQWELFCSAIGRLELMDDPRFQDGFSRSQHYDALEPIFNEAFLQKSTQEWLDEFTALGIPCGPVNTIDKVAADPQVQHRGMIAEVRHPALGPVKTVGSPLKLSRTPPVLDRAAPDMGEHTDEVLKALLGMSDAELASLREEKVI